MYMYVGLRVTEVAHDIQQQVSRFVTEMGLVNSYDTWHGILYTHKYNSISWRSHIQYLIGTKNVAKQVFKVSQGRVRDKGVTWFPELVDKRTLVYMYYYTCTHNYVHVCVSLYVCFCVCMLYVCFCVGMLCVCM